jgi:hypothetical protein
MGQRYSVRAPVSLTHPAPIDTKPVKTTKVFDRNLPLVGMAPPENGEDEVGWFAGLIDNLQRGAYAVKSAIQSTYDDDPTGNLLTAAAKGWNLENRVTGAGELESAVQKAHDSGAYDKLSDIQKMAVDFVGSNFFKATGGMTYDVATDPLTYIPGKVIAAPVTGAAKVISRAGIGAKSVAKGTATLTEEAARAKGLGLDRVHVGEEVGPKTTPAPTATPMRGDVGGALFPEPQLGPGKVRPEPPRSASGAIIVEPTVGGPHTPTFDPTTRGAGAEFVNDAGQPVFAPETIKTGTVSGLTDAKNLSNAHAARLGQPVKPPGPTDFLPKAGEGNPLPQMLDPRLKRAKLANPIEPKPASPVTDTSVVSAAAHDVEQAAKAAEDVQQALDPVVTQADMAANEAVNTAGDVRATDGAKTNVGIPDGPYPTERWNTVANNNKMAERAATYVKTAREYADRNAPLFSEVNTREAARKIQLQKTLANDKHSMLQSGTAPVVPFKAAGEKIPKKYFLHLSDVMSVVPDTIYRSFYKIKGQTAPSSWLGAAAAAVHYSNAGKTGPELTNLVEQAFKDYHKLRSGKPSSSMAAQAAKALTKPEALSKLHAHLLENEQFIAQADHAAGKAVGESAAANLKAVLDDPGSSMSKELVAVADLHGSIARQIEAARGLPGEASAATQTAREAASSLVDDLDVAAARTTLRTVKAAQRGDEVAVRRIGLEQYRRDANAAKEISNRDASDFASNAARSISPRETFAPPANIIADLADQEAENFLNYFQRVYRGTALKLQGGAGQGKFFGVRRRTANTFQTVHGEYNFNLGKAEKDYGREAVDNMFSQIWNGTKREDLSQANKLIYDDLYPLMKGVVDPAGGFLDNAVLRSGLTIEGFNSSTKARGIPWLELKEEYPGQPLAEAFQNQIKGFKIEDPLDFLSKFNAVGADAAVHNAMARAAEAKGSVHYQEGYSRIARSKDFRDAPVSHYIDNEMWIPNNIVEELRLANRDLLKTVNWGKSNTPVARFMNQVFDPMTRAWKTFATSLRPGHHLANASGDTITNFIHGVNPTDYLRGSRALRSVGMTDRMPYEIMEQIAMGKPVDDMLRAGKKATPEARAKTAAMASEHNLTMTLKGGKKVSYTNGQFGDGLLSNGAISHFRQLEDIEAGNKIMENRFNRQAGSAIDQGLERVMNTRYGRLMEKSGEWNANLQRGAQVAKHLRDPKFTKKFATEEEAWEAAVESSLRAHPDAGGLSAFEKKWGRRVMPFYSYTRQILPWVVTNMLAHPGRMVAIPKAQYNMQVLFGQDPKQIGAPFSGYENLPPWARAIMGGNIMGPEKDPTARNIGFSLSSPLDTLAEFTNTPADQPNGGLLGSFSKATVSMLNPLITAPSRLTNPSKDQSEELDKTLPGLTTVSGITGRSPTGTLGNILGGKPQLDPTRSYESGQRTQFLNEALLNFFTGLRIQDFSDYSAAAPGGLVGSRM